MRIEIWHLVGESLNGYSWGVFYSWRAVFETLPSDAWKMRWTIRKVIRPRAVQLLLK